MTDLTLTACPSCGGARSLDAGDAVVCTSCGHIEEPAPEAPDPSTLAVAGGSLVPTEVVLRLSTGEDALNDLTAAHTSHAVRTELSRLVVEATAIFREVRAQRLGDHKPVEADVAPLVRRLTQMRHALLGLADDFKAAADVCKDEIAEERSLVSGPRSPGYTGPLKTVRIPDGPQDIVIADKVKRSTEFHDGAVIAVLADLAAAQVSKDATVLTSITTETLIEQAARAGALAALREAAPMLTGGRFSWKSTSIEGLRKRLMAAENDVAAGALERAKTVRVEPTGDIEVRYEEPTGRTR